MIQTAWKFGVFVAICLAFTLYLASTIGNTTLLGLVGRGPSTYEITAAFDDVTGLLLDDNVKVAGVVVGKVTGIEVESGQAVVTMNIKSDTPPLPSDSQAQVRWRNLIGQRFIYIIPGEASTTLADGAVIDDTISVVDLGELFNRLGPIVAAIDSSKVNEFLETVTQALEGNEDQVSRALDDLAVLVKGLGERDQAISRLIGNLDTVARTISDREQQLETVLTNLTDLAQTFSDNTTLLETAILEIGEFNTDLSFLLQSNRDELDRVLTNLDRTLNTVEANLGPLEVALDNVDEGAAAIFRSSRNGEFLNQAILCAAAGPPVDGSCTTPIISGLAAVNAPAAPSGPVPTGGDALDSLLGEVFRP